MNWDRWWIAKQPHFTETFRKQCEYEEEEVVGKGSEQNPSLVENWTSKKRKKQKLVINLTSKRACWRRRTGTSWAYLLDIYWLSKQEKEAVTIWLVKVRLFTLICYKTHTDYVCAAQQR